MSDYYAATTEQLVKAQERIRELESLLKECEEAILEARRIIDPCYPQRAWDWQADAEDVLIKLRMRK